MQLSRALLDEQDNKTLNSPVCKIKIFDRLVHSENLVHNGAQLRYTDSAHEASLILR